LGTPPSELPSPSNAASATQGAKNNGLAVVSLVTGLASFLGHIIPIAGGLTLSVVAIVTGHMARSEIKKTGEPGMALATAGLVIGYAHLAMIALFVIAFFGFIVALIGGLFVASRQ
jgi:hypothetical protein